jgi:hypothetical protein
LPVSFISLRLERVDNLGAYRIPPETGILIPSGFNNNGTGGWFSVSTSSKLESSPRIGGEKCERTGDSQLG